MKNATRLLALLLSGYGLIMVATAQDTSNNTIIANIAPSGNPSTPLNIINSTLETVVNVTGEINDLIPIVD